MYELFCKENNLEIFSNSSKIIIEYFKFNNSKLHHLNNTYINSWIKFIAILAFSILFIASIFAFDYPEGKTVFIVIVIFIGIYFVWCYINKTGIYKKLLAKSYYSDIYVLSSQIAKEQILLASFIQNNKLSKNDLKTIKDDLYYSINKRENRQQSIKTVLFALSTLLFTFLISNDNIMNAINSLEQNDKYQILLCYFLVYILLLSLIQLFFKMNLIKQEYWEKNIYRIINKYDDNRIKYIIRLEEKISSFDSKNKNNLQLIVIIKLTLIIPILLNLIIVFGRLK